MKGINRIDSSTRLWASAKAPNSNWGLGFPCVVWASEFFALELPFNITHNFFGFGEGRLWVLILLRSIIH